MISKYDLATWIDDLSDSNDFEGRQKAVANISLIAKSLGPETTRTRFLEYLKPLIQDEDIRPFLAKEIGNLKEWVGGSSYLKCFLSLFELLFDDSEIETRQFTIISFLDVLSLVQEEDFPPFVEFVLTLSTNDTFCFKTASVELIPTILNKLQDQKERKQLLASYIELSKDKMLIVRKRAAENMRDKELSSSRKKVGLVSVVSDGDMCEHVYPMFVSLLKDNQDSVRQVAVECCPLVCQKLIQIRKTAFDPSIVKNLFFDSSWRIRFVVAQHLAEFRSILSDYVDEEFSTSNIIKLIKDSVSEVRYAACNSIRNMIKDFNPSQLKNLGETVLLPECLKLLSDSNLSVRTAAMSSLFELATLLGKDVCVSKLLPTIKDIAIKDSYQLNLYILSQLPLLMKVIDFSHVSDFLIATIEKLSKANHWRIRIELIRISLTLKEFMNVSGQRIFKELIEVWANDCVYSVRQEVIKAIPIIAKYYGPQWTNQSVLPLIHSLISNSNYSLRITGVSLSLELILVHSDESILAAVFPYLFSSSCDKISNVRLNVASAFGFIKKCVIANDFNNSQEVLTQIISQLEILSVDKDNDVRWFATTALNCE